MGDWWTSCIACVAGLVGYPICSAGRNFAWVGLDCLAWGDDARGWNQLMYSDYKDENRWICFLQNNRIGSKKLFSFIINCFILILVIIMPQKYFIVQPLERSCGPCATASDLWRIQHFHSALAWITFYYSWQKHLQITFILHIFGWWSGRLSHSSQWYTNVLKESKLQQVVFYYIST
jgi:hypothetical protein